MQNFYKKKKSYFRGQIESTVGRTIWVWSRASHMDAEPARSNFSGKNQPEFRWIWAKNKNKKAISLILRNKSRYFSFLITIIIRMVLYRTTKKSERDCYMDLKKHNLIQHKCRIKTSYTDAQIKTKFKD